jgi:hypothetical protein
VREVPAGVAEVACRAADEHDCGYIGLDLCERGCGDGDLELCLALARWHEQNRRLGGERARALQLWRLACTKAHGESCVALVVNSGATAADLRMPAQTLGPLCARGDPCACRWYGEALSLTSDSSQRGIDLLSDACRGGAIDACDSLAVATELCERDAGYGGFCGRLLQGRPRPAAPLGPPSRPLARATLPAALEACFVVPGSPFLLPNEKVVARRPRTDRQPPSACPYYETLGPGAVFCFAQDRYFVRPTRGGRDVRPVEWQRSPDGRSFSARQPLIEMRTPDGTRMGRDGAVDEVHLGPGVTPTTVRVVGLGLEQELQRLTGAEEEAARSEIRAWPALETTCRQAARCEQAIPGGLDRSPDDGLCSCEERMAAARAALMAQQGAEAARASCP